MRCPVGNTLSVGFGDWGLLRSAFSFLCYLKKKKNELKGTQAVHILAAANEFILKKKKEKFQKFL